MDSFGLGLVLSFVDNASSGMNSATDSLKQMTDVAEQASSTLNNVSSYALAGQAATTLGTSMTSAGGAINSVVMGLINNVSNMGSTLENARITLSRFWGSAEEGERMLDWIMDFGARSPFESMDLIPIAVSFKAAGVDISESVQMVDGGTQELMSTLSDLMSLKPEVPMSRWKLAFQNALSGQEKVLQNTLDVGILEDKLGHAFGSGADAVQSLVELTQSLGLEGMTSDLFGTWGQTMSNLSDVWDKFLKEIADAGAFSTLKNALMNVADALGSIDENKMEQLGKVVSDGLSIILVPLTKLTELAGKFITWFSDLAVAHPIIAKLIIGITGVAGISLLAVGTLLKFAGSIFMLMSSFQMMTAAGGGLSAVLGLIGTQFFALIAAILPVIAVIGLFYLAWTKDIGGLRTTVTNFVSGVSSSFKTAKDALNGSLGSFLAITTRLRRESNEGNWFSGLGLSILKVMTFFRALGEAWDDNTLSEDTFLKARNLGVLPLLESILIFKYNMGQFIDGFVTGFDKVVKKITELKNSFKGVSNNVDPVFGGITKFLDNLNLNDFEKFGEKLGSLVTIATILFTVFKVGSLVLGILSSPLGVLIGLVIAWDKNLFGLQDTVKKVFAKISEWVDKVITFFENIDWDTVIANFNSLWLEITDFATWAYETVIEPTLIDIEDLFNSVSTFISQIDWDYVFASLERGLDSIKNVIELAKPYIEWLWDNFLLPVASWTGGTIISVLDDLNNAFGAITDWMVANKDVVDGMALAIAGFFAVWKVTELLAFIQMSGGVVGALSAITKAITGATLAKTIDKLETMYLTALYAKDFVVGLAKGTLEIGKQIGQWMIMSGLKIKDAIQTGVLTALYAKDFVVGLAKGTLEIGKQIGQWMIMSGLKIKDAIQTGVLTVATGALSIAQAALNVIMNMNPISLIIIAILGLIAVFVILWNKCEGFRNVVTTIFEGIKEGLKIVINGIIDFINVFIRAINLIKIPDWVPGIGGVGINIPEIPKLNTGGYIKGEGISYLHPNEVVINDELTQGLRAFLNDFSATKKEESIITQNNITTKVLGASVGATVAEQEPPRPTYRSSTGTDSMMPTRKTQINEGMSQSPFEQNDNSVTFEKGSIVVQVQNASEEEAERMANLIMQKIERKQQQQKMRNYNFKSKLVMG